MANFIRKNAGKLIVCLAGQKGRRAAVALEPTVNSSLAIRQSDNSHFKQQILSATKEQQIQLLNPICYHFFVSGG